MIQVGIIGLSKDNGHPYSFSAIVNGYSEEYFLKSDWNVILDYLKNQDSTDFKDLNATITHAWTQDRDVTENLCKSCFIKNNCQNIDEMIAAVDAVIIARDDWETHFSLAKPFLLKGIPVFIDKPLTLDPIELEFFLPYLKNGLLMSCSGLRFATELNSLKSDGVNDQKTKLISATILNDLEKYGIHMLEAIASIDKNFSTYENITRLQSSNEAFLINCSNGTPIVLNCLGDVSKTFHLSLFLKDNHHHFNFSDNFGSFKAALKHFFEMVETRIPPIDPVQTYNLMQLITKAKQLKPGQTLSF